MSKSIPMIPTSEPYSPIGHLLLANDTLKPNEMPKYQRDIAMKAYVVGRRGETPTTIVEPEELLIPPIEISSKPTIKEDEMGKCDYDIAERIDVRCRDTMNRQIDVEVLKVINAAASNDHSIKVDKPSWQAVAKACTKVEEHELTVHYIVMHTNVFNQLDELGHKDYIRADHKSEDTDKHIGGYLSRMRGTATILVSTMVPKNAVYILANPLYVGVLVRTKLRNEDESGMQVSEGYEAEKSRQFWVYRKVYGFGVINDYAIARVLVDNSSWLFEQVCDGTTLINEMADTSIQELHVKITNELNRRAQMATTGENTNYQVRHHMVLLQPKTPDDPTGYRVVEVEVPYAPRPDVGDCATPE